MAKKYYVKMKGDVPVEGSLKSYANNPGYPYKEVSIPNCCDLDKVFTIPFVFEVVGCTVDYQFEINGIIVPPDPGVVVDQTSFVNYIVYLNLAYTGILSFEIVTGSTVSTTVLVDFDTFEIDWGFVCE